MRRLIPYILLAALGVFTFAAALVGSGRSQDVSYYSLPVGSSAAKQALDKDIRATLEAPSYTFRSGETVIEYGAPNRARVLDGSEISQIQIGSNLYLHLPTIDGPGTWQEIRAPQAIRLSVLSFPRSELETLLRLTSVEQDGSIFTAYRVIPASLVSPTTSSAQYLITYKVVARSGYVVSDTYTASGSPPVVIPMCHHPKTIFSCYRIPTSRFSAFGTTPPVDPPPSNEVVLAPRTCGFVSSSCTKASTPSTS